MKVALLHRFAEGSTTQAGETLDPGLLNENLQHLAACINGGLGADNLAKAYRLPMSTIRRYLTPIPFTCVLEPDSGGVADLRTALIRMPTTYSNGVGGGFDVGYLSHVDFSYVRSDLGIVQINQADGVKVAAFRNGTAAANKIWETTYDIPVPAFTYVWGQGQIIKQAAGTDTDLSFAINDSLWVQTTAGGALAATTSLRVRVWMYFPQAIIPATSPTEAGALQRRILPPQWA